MSGTLRYRTYVPYRMKRAAASGSSSLLVPIIWKTGVSLLSCIRARTVVLTACLTVQAAHAFDPRLPGGDPAYDPSQAVYDYRFDNSKAARLLGVKYISIGQVAEDIVSQVQDKIEENWVERAGEFKKK